ncbi:MAG: hypothetical protein AAGG51_30450 [Cyanobacteria bacterium P01_G01_bin.54]
MSSFNPAPFNPLRGFLTSENIFAERQLDEAFTLEQRKAAVQHWSQLVAWSWLTPDDLARVPDSSDSISPQSEALRRLFIMTLKDLARWGLQNYYLADAACAAMVKEHSQKLSDLLAGRTRVDGLNLPDFYEKHLGKQPLIFAQEVEGRIFADYFWFGVQVDHYWGMVVDYAAGDTADVDATGTTGKFTLLISYPARPSLENPDVLTRKELYDWATYEGSEEFGQYYPPNPYIPTCIC